MTKQTKARQALSILTRDFAWQTPKLVRASIDTVELWLRYPPKTFREGIESKLGPGEELPTRPIHDKQGNYRGLVACINRPNLAVIDHVYDLRAKYFDSSVRRVDVACDFQMANWDEQRHCFHWLERHVLLNWRPSAPRKFYGYGTYWLPFPYNGWNRNLFAYLKDNNVVRLELRLLCSATVRKANFDRLRLGLNTHEGMMGLNPNGLFRRHIRLARLTDRYKIECVRRSVRNERLRFLANGDRRQRSPKANERYDEYRLRTADYSRAILDKQGMTEFVVGAPPSALERIDFGVLGIPTKLTWLYETAKASITDNIDLFQNNREHVGTAYGSTGT